MNTTLPPDWKPAEFNPNFNADEEVEEQNTSLDRLRCVLNAFSDLTTVHGQNEEVNLRRDDLAGVFTMLRNEIESAAKRNGLIHKYVCNLWGLERIQAERILRGEVAKGMGHV